MKNPEGDGLMEDGSHFTGVDEEIVDFDGGGASSGQSSPVAKELNNPQQNKPKAQTQQRQRAPRGRKSHKPLHLEELIVRGIDDPSSVAGSPNVHSYRDVDTMSESSVSSSTKLQTQQALLSHKMKFLPSDDASNSNFGALNTVGASIVSSPSSFPINLGDFGSLSTTSSMGSFGGSFVGSINNNNNNNNNNTSNNTNNNNNNDNNINNSISSAVSQLPLIDNAEGSNVIITQVIQDVLGPDIEESLTRDEAAKREEEQLILDFKVIRNDSNIENLKLLLALKNVFSRQLPKMPKDYISRLVFDKKHRSLVGFKNGKVVGGITFRPFFESYFAEIAFLAVITNEQVKGYGTRLMNHLKKYCQSVQIFRFLTYADNYAMGYFKKQGFTKEITLDEDQYKGKIKDYEGATLMECVIREDINYLDVPGMVRRQKALAYEKVKEVSNSHIVHKGLNIWQQQQQQQTPSTCPSLGAGKFLFLPNLSDIPGLRDLKGYQLKHTDQEIIDLQRVFLDIYTAVRNQKEYSWPFLEPVNREEVKDYYDIIKDPMSLKTIKQRIERFFYRTKLIFIQDFKLMFNNCRLYNDPKTEYYKCANKLEEFFNLEIKNRFS